jgi:ABC-type multidrug transport system permease subunit
MSIEDTATQAPSAISAHSLFHRVWPPAGIAAALIATMVWTSLLGYVLFKFVFRVLP